MAELRTSYRQAYCTLWEHRDMQGARLRMPNGERMNFAVANNSSWRDLPDWNDVVSSATIDSGCRLEVWEHEQATGERKAWSGGQNGWRVNYVGDAWNDRVSSAICSCN